MNNRTLRALLAQYHIDTSMWGHDATKRFEDLLKEVLEGETTLEVDDGHLVRTVHVACAHVYYQHPTMGRLKLYETKQVFRDGSDRERDFPQSVSEKFKRFEDSIEAGLRGLEEELQIPRQAFSTPENLDYIEQPPRTYSPSYPGLESKYRRYHFEVELIDDTYFNSDGYVEDDGKKCTYFEWRSC